MSTRIESAYRAWRRDRVKQNWKWAGAVAAAGLVAVLVIFVAGCDPEQKAVFGKFAEPTTIVAVSPGRDPGGRLAGVTPPPKRDEWRVRMWLRGAGLYYDP